MRRFSFLLPFFGTFAFGEIHLSSTENYTQEEARLYCRDIGPQWRQMQIAELFHSQASFREGFSYWSGNIGPSDSTVVGTGSEGDGGIIAMVGYSFYPKERNITLSVPTKKIAAACINTPYPKRVREYRLSSLGTEDKVTHLLWHSLEATDKRKKFSYDQAKEECENLTLGNRTWRLPSLDELYGIVDYEHFRPSVDMKYFGPMMHRYYWSSDLLNEKEGYVVGFKLGSVATVNKIEPAYVRCVSE